MIRAPTNQQGRTAGPEEAPREVPGPNVRVEVLQPHIGGKCCLRRPQPRDHGAEARRVFLRQRVPSHAHMHAAVVAGIGMGHGTNETVTIGEPSKTWQEFADARSWDRRGNRPIGAANLVGRVWFWVPSVNLAGAAILNHENTCLGSRSQCFRRRDWGATVQQTRKR